MLASGPGSAIRPLSIKRFRNHSNLVGRCRTQAPICLQPSFLAILFLLEIHKRDSALSRPRGSYTMTHDEAAQSCDRPTRPGPFDRSFCLPNLVPVTCHSSILPHSHRMGGDMSDRCSPRGSLAPAENEPQWRSA